MERADRRPLQEEVAALALAPAERVKVAGAADPGGAFLRLWVRKEAMVKAGELSLDGLGAADLSALEPGARWRGLCLRDWSEGAVQGAAVAVDPPRFHPLEPRR